MKKAQGPRILLKNHTDEYFKVDDENLLGISQDGSNYMAPAHLRYSAIKGVKSKSREPRCFQKPGHTDHFQEGVLLKNEGVAVVHLLGFGGWMEASITLS